MKNKFISMLMAVVMSFSMVTSAFAADFKDVPESHKNYEAIETLEVLDLVAGYDNKNFGPEDVLSRAQLCAMMVRAIYGDDIHYSADNVFTDVPVTHWAREFVDTAYRAGLMKGYGNGFFGPDDKLTYTQTARVILTALGYGDLTWPVGVNAVAHELSLFDNVKVADYDAGCTRAHAAQMIYNAFDLELVKEYAGQHFGTEKTFLNDVLGYTKTSKYEDGHVYVAYKNNETKKVFVTNVKETYEDVIYVKDENSYTFTDSKRATVHDFDWKNVDLFVNGVETNDVSWYVNADSAIGVFNDEDDLIAIYVENKGDIWIPATGFNETNVPKDVIDEVYDDKNFNERTSMITYFVEDGAYIITNKIVCGFIDEASTKSIWVNDIKYTFDVAHDYNVDDYIVMYMDGDEIIDCMIVANPYGYNLTDKEYHSWDCNKYEDRSKNDTWVETLDDVWHADGKITFKPCSHCEANEKISLVSVPTIAPEKQ